MSKKKAMADPVALKAFDADDKKLLRVIIETPKGSRKKVTFSEEERIFELKKVLPAGMEFLYDFGFVPSTRADDGDPVDVLVLMDEPAFAGCMLSARPIGVIEREQGSKKKKERNDRIVAIRRTRTAGRTSKRLEILGKQFCRERAGGVLCTFGHPRVCAKPHIHKFNIEQTKGPRRRNIRTLSSQYRLKETKTWKDSSTPNNRPFDSQSRALCSSSRNNLSA